MNQEGKKVLVLDIDGTLTNSEKKITEATVDALQSIMKQGHKVILASGSNLPFPTPEIRGVEAFSPSATVVDAARLT